MNGREAEVSGKSLGLNASSEVQAVLKASCGRVMPYTGRSQTLGCHKPGPQEGGVSWGELLRRKTGRVWELRGALEYVGYFLAAPHGQ